MVLNKLFGKKSSNSQADLNSLKERFSQVGDNKDGAAPATGAPGADVKVEDSIAPEANAETQLFGQQLPDKDGKVPAAPTQQTPQAQSPQPSAAPAQTNQQSAPEQSAPVAQPNPVPAEQAPQTPPAAQVPDAPTQSDHQPFGQTPIGMAPTQSAPAAQPAPTQSSQESPADATTQPSAAPAVQPNPGAPTQVPTQQMPAVGQGPQDVELPSWAVESAEEQQAQATATAAAAPAQEKKNAVTETLEQIEDKYYDAKLNSLIIDQVKELIEIDNNLNTKIDDLSSEMKKETIEREKVAKTVEQHFDKVKEIERNMEKFLGLYEMVTNQFNPFVDKDDDSAQGGASQPAPTEAPPAQVSPQAPPQQMAPPAQAPQQSMQQSAPAVAQGQVPSAQTAQSPLWNYCPIHHNIHPSLHFELKNGQKLGSIYDVLAVLEQMDDDTFMHHVNLKQNDFSNWIYRVLGLADLGQALDPVKTKPEMIHIVRDYIQQKMKEPAQ